MKKLVIDARMVAPLAHGFSRYVSRLAEGLSKLSVPYEPVFLVNKAALERMPESPLLKFRTLALQSKFLALKELWEIPSVLRKEKADLYHSPTFSSLLPALMPCPWLVTVHDLNHLTYGNFKQELYYKKLLKPFARKAAQLCTVSEFSRQEIQTWLGAGYQKPIELAYNALDAQWAHEPVSEDAVRWTADRFALQRQRYFLCISNPKPHKNVEFLVQAYTSYRSLALQKGLKPWSLALTLQGFEHVPGVQCLGHVEDAWLKPLMKGAGALAFPSLYEGFGLPPVEAVIQGLPVIVSKIAPHQEAVAGLQQSGMFWADPKSFSAWVFAMSWVAERAEKSGQEALSPKPEFRQGLLERYSVERLAGTMDRIYRRLLSC